MNLFVSRSKNYGPFSHMKNSTQLLRSTYSLDLGAHCFGTIGKIKAELKKLQAITEIELNNYLDCITKIEKINNAFELYALS